MIRVAIIDDHYVVRVGLKTIIDMDPELQFAGEASSGEGAAAFVMTAKPDVLLLDIRMPGKDGIETLADILAAKPSQKVVMLTTSDADDEVYRALNNGARGYLLKDRDSDAICMAVKTVHAGSKFIPDAVKEIYRRRQMMAEPTPREREVLELVADGLSNDEVAKSLGISYESVKVHMKHLLFKFEARDRTELVSAAIRGGFVKEAPAKSRAASALAGAFLMLASSVFAAGPTSATAVDVKGAATIPGGRVVLPMNDGWEFKWGGDKASGEWKTVDLPHDAQFEQPWTKNDSNGARGFKPMGEMWYRKRFALPKGTGNREEGTGKRVFLEFGGMLCVGDVYVNGKNVGGTEYGYLPVWCDITDALKADGDNVVEVWCSTGKLGGSRWYTGAGLYRDAKLVVKPKVAIARHGIFVKSRVEGGSRGRSPSRDAVVSLTVELDGFRGMGNNVALDVVADIKDASGKVVASASARAPWSKLRHQEVALPDIALKNAVLWDIDSPNLYTADVRLVYNGSEIDREEVRFGVRKIEMDHTYGLKLNGRKVFLASMSNHHDLGLVGAAAYPRAIRRQFETMKKFGYNAIRCSHNPYSEEFYDLADEMGLLVLDELIDKWSDRSCWFGRRPFTQIWPQLVTEWIKRDRNHPSVFAWSFGNELQMNEDLCGYQCLGDWGVTMYRLMKTLAERWDPTRPTTVAMFPARSGARGGRDPVLEGDPIPPELAVATDFASFNYRWKDYAGYLKHEPQLNIFQSEAAVSELQAPFVGMDREHSIGCSWWGAVEYWGESNGWPKKGWSYAVFSHALEPFPSAYLLKSVISDEPVVRIAVETGKGESEEWNDVQVGVRAEASAWEGRNGEKKRVRVYTNCEAVELFLNGKSLGSKANDDKSPKGTNVVSFDVPFEPGELKAVGKCKMESVKCKMSGDVGCRSSNVVSHSVRTAGDPVALKAEVEGCGFTADGRDLVYVKCHAVDENGTQVRSYGGKVSFACEGAARFLACDSGDHYTDELFTSDITAKKAKGGFILAVFRAGTVPGEAKITITPERLPPVELRVSIGDRPSARSASCRREDGAASFSWPERTQTMKPWVYNWWMGSAVDDEGLEFQCRELAEKGFGGFHVIPIYGAKNGYEKKWKPLLSPEWVEAWNSAARKAEKRGLGIDLTMGSGWCFGGPWIDKDHAVSSGVKVKRAGLGGEGYMLDPFDPEAMKIHVAAFDKLFGKGGAAARPRAFYHDSYEYYGAKPKNGGDVDDLQLACFRVWTDWCRENGYTTRNEAHGAPSNWLDFYALADIPETEMFGKNDRDILISKFASSSAHVKGTTLVSAESCTWIDEHFNERPAEIKEFLDRLFLSGVNHVFYHGCCYSPVEAAWPGWCFYASLEMNPRNPIWREMGAMNAYVTRCQSLFQTWTPDNDVAVLWDPKSFRRKHKGKVVMMSVHGRKWFYGEKIGKVAKELYEAGYAFDYVSPRMVKAGLAKKYAALVDPKVFNAEMQRSRGEILGGVRKMPFDAKSGLLATRWRKDGETAYFVVNTGAVAKVVSAKGAFTSADPLTGEIAAVREVVVEPMHSRFIVGDGFDVRDGAAAKAKAVDVPGPWRVEPICGGPEMPAPRTLDALVGWETFDDAFSGTMVYSTKFDCGSQGSSPSRDCGSQAISLGEVREIARVRLNGHDLGVRFMAPYDFAVPDGVLKEKGNVLEVEVTNLGANRLRWNDLNGVKWKYFCDINVVGMNYKPFDASKWNPLKSGLLGPVEVFRLKTDRAGQGQDSGR